LIIRFSHLVYDFNHLWIKSNQLQLILDKREQLPLELTAKKNFCITKMLFRLMPAGNAKGEYGVLRLEWD
jgi:hypothetical protein